jgi:putative transposase
VESYAGSRFAPVVVVRIYSIALVDAHAKPMWHYKSVIALFQIVLRLLTDLNALTALAFRRRRATAAEILVLRRQIALYKERGVKPRRIDAVTRISLALLSRFFNWRDTLVVVRPETMIRWHRAGWKLFWRLKSRAGRPPIPLKIQTLIRRIANENASWGEERIANELLLKLGIQVSPRTVSKYLPKRPTRRPKRDMRWSTFLRLHAQGIIACDSSSPSLRLSDSCTYLW